MGVSVNGIVNELGRATEVATAKVIAQGRRGMGKSAESLSRRGRLAARCVVLSEAVCKLIKLAYEKDTDGYPANIDVDGRLRVPVPWGTIGRDYFHLQDTEANVLRRYILKMDNADHPAFPPVFDYEEDSKRWYLSYLDFPAISDALGWWEENKLTPAQWRIVAKELLDEQYNGAQ